MKYLSTFGIKILLVLLSLTPVMWFIKRPGYLINGVDTNFPLDPIIWFTRRFYVWNSVVNSGADFSSSTSGLFFHFLQALFKYIGLSLQAVEMITLVFWFSLIIISAYLFIKAVTKNSISQIVFVIFYAFNTYLFNTWENVKVSNIALVIGLPLFLGGLIRYQNKNISKTQFIVWSAIGGILVSGSGINPAYFIVLIGGLTFFTFGSLIFSQKKDRAHVIKGYLLMTILIFLVNAHWILPTLNFLLLSKNQIRSLTDIGFVDWLDSLSKNTSLANVLRLQGAWDWYEFNEYGEPLYLPYVVNYFLKIPFILFSYLIPTLVLVSLLIRNKRYNKYYFIFSLLAIISVFLGSGTHEPTGNLYKLLVLKVPFFSFFRSPWYIFTPYLIISYACLIALLLESVNRIRIIKFFIPLLGITIVIGNIFYSYPLISGKIFRPSKVDGFYIKFPQYLDEVKQYLNSQPVYPRVLSYPDDTLENYEWGYKGVESITGLFSNKEFITASANSSKGYGNITQQIYNYLKKKQYKTALNLLPFIGVDTIVDKKDITSLAPEISKDIENYTSKKEINSWTFYKLNTSISDKVFAPQKILSTNHKMVEDFPSLAETLPQQSIVISQPDTIISQILDFNSNIKNSITNFYQAENVTFQDEPSSNIQKYIVNIANTATYYLILEKHSQFKDPPTSVLIDENWELKNPIVGESGYKFGPIDLESGKHDVSIKFPDSDNVINIKDYSKITNTSSFRSSDLPTDLTKTLVVYNAEEKNKTIHIPVSKIYPFEKYLFSLDYRYEYGRLPTIDLHQYNIQTQLKTENINLPVSRDWTQFQQIFDPIPTESNLDVFINLYGDKMSGRSKSLFENFSLKLVNDEELFFVEDNDYGYPFLPEVKIINKSPVKYEISVKNGTKGYILAFLENFSQDWSIKINNTSLKPYHFMINNYANGWYVPETGLQEQLVTIEYKPQQLFNIGITISGITIGLASLMFIKNKLIKRN